MGAQGDGEVEGPPRGADLGGDSVEAAGPTRGQARGFGEQGDDLGRQDSQNGESSLRILRAGSKRSSRRKPARLSARAAWPATVPWQRGVNRRGSRALSSSSALQPFLCI